MVVTSAKGMVGAFGATPVVLVLRRFRSSTGSVSWRGGRSMTGSVSAATEMGARLFRVSANGMFGSATGKSMTSVGLESSSGSTSRVSSKMGEP